MKSAAGPWPAPRSAASAATMDKLVVLARGLGTRMRRSDDDAALDRGQAAVADTGVKAMIPLGGGAAGTATDGAEGRPCNRPFLDYVLSAAADAGFRRACLVIGPEQDAIRRYYGDQSLARRLTFSFASQAQPKGTADAVAAAESFAAGDYFAVINSDDYYPVEALRGLREQSGSAVALFERDAMLTGSNVPEERIKRFAVATIDGRGCLERVIEKPDGATLAALPQPLWLSMNCWRFGPSIFAACRAISPSPRGEFELPDAVRYAMTELGEQFRAIKVHAPVLDMTSRGDIGPVTALLSGVEVCL
jgi:dTDP-glucose pyrophosphorylase